MNTLKQALSGPVYAAYSYSYPHKSAYRHLAQAQPLAPLWQAEDRDALFLYIHIPFCEMRCGFCNLFTLVRPPAQLPETYFTALERQARQLADILGTHRFARFAIGGGTPSYLNLAQLERLFTLAGDTLGVDSQRTPTTIETSPETIDAQKIQLFEDFHVDRLSMGVQSFIDTECQALARRQQSTQVHKALDMLRQHSSAALNLDLIYGIEGQTPASWTASLTQALSHEPQELYLYPLYVREKTGLSRIQQKHPGMSEQQRDQRMLELYRIARDFLRARDYEQISMRMFRKKNTGQDEAPLYRCQDDGMLGLGAGARSYTRQLHYSSEYAVGRQDISSVIAHYINTSDERFAYADYGIHLNTDEQKRRYLMQSLLLSEGLDTTGYKERFGSDCLEDFSALNELFEQGLAEQNETRIHLSERGMERADTLGPWLASSAVLEQMKHYIPR